MLLWVFEVLISLLTLLWCVILPFLKVIFVVFHVIVIIAADAIVVADAVVLSLLILFLVGVVVAADVIAVEERGNRDGG